MPLNLFCLFPFFFFSFFVLGAINIDISIDIHRKQAETSSCASHPSKTRSIVIFIRVSLPSVIFRETITAVDNWTHTSVAEYTRVFVFSDARCGPTFAPNRFCKSRVILEIRSREQPYTRAGWRPIQHTGRLYIVRPQRNLKGLPTRARYQESRRAIKISVKFIPSE